MKKYLFAMALFVAAFGLTSCSSDDDEVVIDPANVGVNVLVIQSDDGRISTGTMYGANERYNPPHCSLSKEIRHNGGDPLTIYNMSFGANIKGSDIFDMLGIGFESDEPMSFSNLKEGDTFDISQFHATAIYTQTWQGDVMKGTKALSGSVTVIGMKNVDDKIYVILRLVNLRFNAIDHSCVYTVNGTVEYEIWSDVQDNELQ